MANRGSFKKGEKKPNQGKRGPNKLTKTVKEAFERVFHDLQKDEGEPHELSTWAKKEPTEFYKIAARLIPSELKGEMTHNHKLPSLEMVEAAIGIKEAK